MKQVPLERAKKKIVIGAAILAILCLVVGYQWGDYRSKSSDLSGCTESLLDPASCSGEASNQVSYLAFRSDLEAQLSEATRGGEIEKAGIYFRDLRNGPILRINETEPFLPMSLMKMPLMIAVLKYAETHPGALDEKVHTPPAFAKNVQVMSQAETLTPDRDYTIAQLLDFMISFSDNQALGVLSQWIDEKAGRTAVIDTLVNLGLMRPQDTLPDSTVSAGTYGAILRILYSAAYLNPEYSQRALDILTRTKFRDGITHDLPSEVRVAHKFGVNDDGNGEVQLHDCGIVYHPVGPYILCVMTSGSDYQKQARYIQSVAKSVYEHVGTGETE